MKFKELDAKLRVFETTHDLCVLPGIFIVARIDGRNFTRLTKEVHPFESPFDARFRDYMVSTTEHLMNCGFRIVYGYTQSDEISLLLHREEETFSRKLRKLNSIFAAEASAKFSLLLGNLAAFDCRISQLPTLDFVVDYFRWRSQDAHRNALNAHCYWMLRRSGDSARGATKKLERLSVSDKNELLYRQAGMNFNDLPNWHKRGVGLYWESYQKEAINPVTGEKVFAMRRQIKIDIELPMKDSYSAFIRDLVLREHPDMELVE
ncbi:guanylyltransferase [Lusitaniella coriacea LEGE 07157]|uniref:tRNA(His) guanylyltransferase n=1 Tax=Lusitaniella coriacea LEGE 07157 TaxID=945747 RepID=A0A8J7DXF0_9CYAN|nr:tRNA(His) guanylyltransferase Thg1 family protein [Lusitaniella coriacea]MBE9116765.1 guanylyltransferase [Lusitaniella coriacea LEGE 07157]